MSLPRLFKSPQSLRGGYINELVDAWFASTAGQRVIAHEQALCRQILPDLFGYHLVQMGYGSSHPLYESSPIHHKVYVAEKPAASPLPRIVCGLDDLAIATDSVDVVVLHHCLDFALHPQRVLREVARVLIPGGRVVVVGFNPWSLWGLWRFAHSSSAKVPWCGRFLSAYRLSDWLDVLDLHVDGYEGTLFGLPVGGGTVSPAGQAEEGISWGESLGQRFWGHWGAVYVMVATKRVCRVTPVKPIVRPKPALISIPLKTQPTSRNMLAPGHNNEEPK